jgi:hypothetical protein
MATVKDLIAAIEADCDEVNLKLQDIRMLCYAVLRSRSEPGFVSVSVDLVAARAAYLVLKAELAALVAGMPESPEDLG